MSDLSGILGQAWLALAVHLWQTSIVLAVVFVLARWLHSAPASLLYRLWSLALLKIVLPLSILGPIAGRVADWPRAAFGRGAGETAWQLPVTLQILFDPSETVTGGGHLPLDWSVWLPVALTATWLAIVWLRAHRLIHDVRLLNRRRGLSWSILSSPEQERTALAMRGTGLSREDLEFAPGCALPHTVGFFRPRILVPMRLVRTLDETELRAVFLHEEGHRRRRDPLRRFLRRSLGCLLFFYPPLRFVDRRLSEAVELVCDERVSKYGVERETFARALSKTIRLGLASNLSPLSAGVGGVSTLRLRIQRISTPGRFSMLTSHRLVLCLVVLLIAVTTFLPVPLRADEPEEAPATAAAAESEGEKAEKEEFPELDKMPETIGETLTKPVYPEKERAAGVEGTVVLRVNVTDAGKPGEIFAVEEVEDHPAFTVSAIAAVRQWRFEPGEIDGEPVACWVQIPIRFRLDAKKSEPSREPEKSDEP